MDTQKKISSRTIETAKYNPEGKNRLNIERGLYLVITPTGVKSWRYDYRLNGRKIIVYGQFPEIGLAQAVELHTDARRLIKQGIVPAVSSGKIVAKKEAEANTGDRRFKTVGEDWYAAKLRAEPDLSESWKYNTRSWLDRAYKAFGNLPLAEVDAANVLKLVKSIEAEGYARTAEEVRRTVRTVFNHGIANLIAPKGFNPADAIKGSVIVPPKKHHAKLEPDDIRPFITAIDASDEPEEIKLGLKILLHCFPRKNELTTAPWSEIDGETWTISAERMKMGREHVVPLSTQVQAMFSRLKELAHGSPYVFPGIKHVLQDGTRVYDPSKPRQRHTFNHALNRLGYQGIFSPHGVRSTAASILADRGYSKDVVDAQLAHAEENTTRASYFRNQYLDQRRKMMEAWSALIDGLAAGAKVIPIGVAA